MSYGGDIRLMSRFGLRVPGFEGIQKNQAKPARIKKQKENTLDSIIRNINSHIVNKKPFSLIRLGDGDLRILVHLMQKKKDWRFAREGIPLNKCGEILKNYRDACNEANYISGFDLYNTNNFWRTIQTPVALTHDCIPLVQKWKSIYKQAGITNKNFCVPEMGWMLFLKRLGRKNLLDLIRNQKVVLVTSHYRAFKKLQPFIKNLALIQIPGQSNNHFRMYHQNCNKIKEYSNTHDIFLIGGGAVGRGYSMEVKRHGKIAIDIGKVFNAWAGKQWLPPYNPYVQYKGLYFKLTPKGMTYEF